MSLNLKAYTLLLAVSALSSSWASAQPLPFYEAQDLTPYWDGDEGSHAPAVAPPFTLLDQESRPVTEKTLSGKIALVNFFFRGCGSVCPMMTQAIQGLQRQLKAAGTAPDLAIFSFSIEPEQDTPAALKVYAQERHLDLSRWSFLTGERAQIYRLGRSVFRADRAIGAKQENSGFIHSSFLYVLDPQRRLRGIYDSQSGKEMQLLAKDLAELEREASH